MKTKKDTSKRRNSASATQIIALGFASIILFGTLLLALPIASRSGESIGFLNALFTATTSTCVTGLIVADTYTQWTLFGQIVILALIQIGGIGFMMAGTLFFMAARRKIGLRERMLLGETISADSMSGIIHFAKRILICVAVIEAVGAILLSIRFIPMFGPLKGIYKSVFHSVSAFCNAGIDLMGETEQYSSFTSVVHDPLINFTVMTLIIIGGLGFIVWENIVNHFRNGERIRLHTKLVLIISAVLTASGFIFFLAFEYSNPSTIGDFNIWQKIQAALFQSVTARTAGFNTIDLAAMNKPSILVMIILMLVGGSPGSTAGGIKTTTVGILVIAAYSVVRGSSKVNVSGRRIGTDQVMRAMAVVMLSIAVMFFGVTVLLVADGIGMEEAFFEVVSAFGTVGCTLGLTTTLSNVSKIMVIVLMYLGRVGVLTATMAITKQQHMYEEKVTYPVETILF